MSALTNSTPATEPRWTGEAIRARRVERGLTHQELAIRSGLYPTVILQVEECGCEDADLAWVRQQLGHAFSLGRVDPEELARRTTSSPAADFCEPDVPLMFDCSYRQWLIGQALPACIANAVVGSGYSGDLPKVAAGVAISCADEVIRRLRAKQEEPWVSGDRAAGQDEISTLDRAC